MNSHSILASKPDILVVEDTLENIRFLATMLSDAGYRVRKAINGSLAFKAIEWRKPDLILMDIRMPDLDGYEVCRRLKRQPETADIPVIFISALGEVLDKIKAFEVGGVDYITKPIEMQEVLVRVKTHLTISMQRKQLMKQNSQLELLLTTTKAISLANDFHSALDVALTQVCEKIGWDFGEVWLPNSIATVFEAAEGWYTSKPQFEDFRCKSKSLIFATNQEFLREICLTKQPCWITDVSIEPCAVFSRNQVAKEVGLKACLGIPILSNDQVLAVLVFLKQEASSPEPRLIELVNFLATQLSSLIQRKHSESVLQENQQQLAGMVADMPGCVYRGVVYPNGKIKLLYMGLPRDKRTQKLC